MGKLQEFISLSQLRDWIRRDIMTPPAPATNTATIPALRPTSDTGSEFEYETSFEYEADRVSEH